MKTNPAIWVWLATLTLVAFCQAMCCNDHYKFNDLQEDDIKNLYDWVHLEGSCMRDPACTRNVFCADAGWGLGTNECQR